ncbi:MAG: formate dehydrogenase subunit delta [Gemmatimonadetes bacterium]|nr:formate dehydrogenase subunit delta [Gemmatimonadota bacterium]
MKPDDLVRMANQIAQFFAPYPPLDATAGVVDHLEKFWTPAMRKELVSVCRGLMPTAQPPHPLVAQAARQLGDGAHE